MAIKQVVLVGHCGVDSYSLRHAVDRLKLGVPVESAEDDETLAKFANIESLLLVNRVMGGHFVETSGIEVIRRLAGGDNPPPMMLISNYPDSQQEAEEAGALPGFGKAELHLPVVDERISAVVGEQSPPSAKLGFK